MKSLPLQTISGVVWHNFGTRGFQTVCDIHVFPKSMLVRKALWRVDISSQHFDRFLVKSIPGTSAIEYYLIRRLEYATNVKTYI
jgi:hypothetical protein